MNKIIYSFFILLVLASCGDSKNTAQNKKILNTRPEKKDKPKDSISYARLSPEIRKYMGKLDSTYSRTPYYFKMKDQLFFYVCKGDWSKLKDDHFKDPNSHLGIVNQNYEVLLPVEYSKLYNPDATADGYIEIEKNGKRGLFNYLTGKIIEAQFDVIFPSEQSGFIAFGKKGNDYFSITEATVESYTGEIPTYGTQKWNFDIHSDKTTLLYDSYKEYYEDDMQDGGGVVVVPSYLYELKFLPEIVDYISTSENEYGLSATEGKVVQTESFTDKFIAIFTSFYEEGVSGRGWQINEKNLIVVDNKNNVISHQQILGSPDYGSLYYCGEDFVSYRYLDQGLVEVQDVIYNEEKDVPYRHMTFYFYYQINENGEINKLVSNRFFDFTKFTLLTDNHFKGCFGSEIAEEFKTIDGVEGNTWLSDHLSIEDLDLMRNEIYAEYGLIFKTEKWKNYFSSKSWYKPQFDNVDHLLSETDKKNLEFIKALQEKMKPNEKSYTNKRWVMFAAAG